MTSTIKHYYEQAQEGSFPSFRLLYTPGKADSWVRAAFLRDTFPRILVGLSRPGTGWQETVNWRSLEGVELKPLKTSD